MPVNQGFFEIINHFILKMGKLKKRPLDLKNLLK